MKERILGKTVGKAGVSQVLIVKTIFVAVICIILGFFLVISSLVNWGKSYFEFLFWIGLFIVAFVPIQFLWLKMEKSSVGKYVFYENGFEDVLKKRKMFFEDVKNYYYLNLKNGFDDVEFIVIEVRNGESLSKNIKEMAKQDKNNKENFEKIVINMNLNRMVSRLFVKNYIEFVLKDEFYKNGANIQSKDNFELKFGIIEENNLMKDKIFCLNMEKNLEKVKISEYIFLNKNGIRVENQEGKILENYLWDEISKITVENFKNKNIKIENENGKIIFSKSMKLVEKPELFVKLVEKYNNFV